MLPPKVDADVTPGIGPLEDDGLSRWAEVTRMPTTLVDWTRLYRDCGLRRTEEYPRVVPNRIGTDPETKLLRIV